jgi:hypothetical protein
MRADRNDHTNVTGDPAERFGCGADRLGAGETVR